MSRRCARPLSQACPYISLSLCCWLPLSHFTKQPGYPINKYSKLLTQGALAIAYASPMKIAVSSAKRRTGHARQCKPNVLIIGAPSSVQNRAPFSSPHPNRKRGFSVLFVVRCSAAAAPWSLVVAVMEDGSEALVSSLGGSVFSVLFFLFEA